MYKKENKPTIVYPKHPFMKFPPQKSPEKKEIINVVKKEENYYEVIFKNYYDCFILMKDTFRILYDTKFPKNNIYDLLTTDINNCFNFLIELFSTIACFEREKRPRILEIIKDVVMEERSLLGVLRLCHSDNGVIRINAFTVLFSFIGYFRELKANFLKYASYSSVLQINTNLKEYHVAVFVINMSSSDSLCIIPDIVGFRNFSRSFNSKKNNCPIQISYSTNIPDFLPLYENYTTWHGSFINSFGTLVEEAEVNIKFDFETKEVEGSVLTMK